MIEDVEKRKKYGVLSNVLFMLRMAKCTAPSVTVLAVLDGLTMVAVSVVELYVAPSILRSLERQDTLYRLLCVILFFTVGITAVSALQTYIKRNLMFGRIEVRDAVLMKVRRKMSTCSYPLHESQSFRNLLSKAFDAMNDNSKAAEAIWNTLSGLLQNSLGFVIYMALLKKVDTVVILATIVTAVVGYVVNYYVNEWNYRHRGEEEELLKKIEYVQYSVQDRMLAKDLRIFGMQEWLRGI